MPTMVIFLLETRRYLDFQGVLVHVKAVGGLPLAEVTQRWFDTWLKGKRGTGVRSVKRPLRLFDMTRKRWVETKRYPFSEAHAQNFYLGDGTLSGSAPGSATGAATLIFTGVSSPCSGNADQYALGALTLALESAGLENPCVRDDRTLGLGPGALTYSTEPMTRPRTLAGPIGARIFATSTRPDVSLIATLEDVSPGGASRYLTSGYLLGSHRALDLGRSWGDGGDLIRPAHPYKRDRLEPVAVGEVTRFDLEIFPVLATLEPGHRLRLTLTSVDTPHITPVPQQMANLLGGVYEVQRTAAHPSRLTIPMASPGRFDNKCRLCG
jgi:putative CocE/NonD family hydrolase